MVHGAARIAAEAGSACWLLHGVESVYFKDGDTQLDAFASDAGFLASADAEKKTRHVFTEDKVTLGVNLKEGRRVIKVEVKPSAASGGETRVLYEADASALSADPEATPAAAPVAFAAAAPAADAPGEQASEPTEFSIDRSAMGDDFGRFEFVVTTGPKEDPADDPSQRLPARTWLSRPWASRNWSHLFWF